MKTVKGKLIERIKRTPSIESFRFKLDESLSFDPGQFVYVIFDEDNPQNESLNKYLSFSSSPTKDYIEVTKRLSDSRFSNRLKSLNLNDTVLFKGPLGNCIFKEEYKKIGFLIGGIGITPVISIIEYIAEKNLKTDTYLLYSNRNEEEIAFRSELDTWIKTHNNIQVCYTVTDCVPQDKTCISARISKDLLMDKIKDTYNRIFFIFGPPKMVEAMKNICLEAKVSQDCIKTENFIGY